MRDIGGAGYLSIPREFFDDRGVGWLEGTQHEASGSERFYTPSSERKPPSPRGEEGLHAYRVAALGASLAVGSSRFGKSTPPGWSFVPAG